MISLGIRFMDSYMIYLCKVLSHDDVIKLFVCAWVQSASYPLTLLLAVFHVDNYSNILY